MDEIFLLFLRVMRFLAVLAFVAALAQFFYHLTLSLPSS